MRGLFISGTDTGVGKSLVAAAVARELRRRGRGVRVSKPVATGADLHDGRWRGDDTLQLARAADDKDLDAITPWTFAEPAAPPVAARCAGAVLELAELAAAVRRRYVEGTALVVEGVGGLLCPLTATATVADLVAALGLPLVVVARRALGTLNHTLLTLEVARWRGLPVAGVVISETEPVRGIATETNVAELARRMTVPLLAVVPHAGDIDAALAAVDWWKLACGVANPGGSRERESCR